MKMLAKALAAVARSAGELAEWAALRALCCTRGHQRKPFSHRCAFCDRALSKPVRLSRTPSPRGAA